MTAVPFNCCKQCMWNKVTQCLIKGKERRLKKIAIHLWVIQSENIVNVISHYWPTSSTLVCCVLFVYFFSSHFNNRCICPLGYTGTFCELDIDNCIGNQCSEHGFCQDHLHNYSCNCVPGYEGPFCEVEINECSSSPCRNGATCMDLIGHFSCHCAAGFKGKFSLLKCHVLQMWLFNSM